MRAYRNVNLNIPGGMISLPVSIAAAVDSGSDAKPKVVGPNGEKVAQVYQDEAGNNVASADTKRQFGDRVLTQDEIKAINDQCKIKDLDIIEVCERDQVDFTKSKGQYFVYSHKKNGNPKALALFIKALQQRDGAALVKWTPSSRQQLLALTVENGALVATALPFGADVKDPDDEVLAHQAHEPTEQELELAGKLLDMVAGDGSTLTTAVDEVVEKKQALIDGAEVAEVTEDEAPQDTGADLMAQLQASLDAQS